MNVETAAWRRDSVEADQIAIDLGGSGRRRRNVAIAMIAVAALLVILLAWYLMRGESRQPTIVSASAAGDAGAPAVTVVVPGRQAIPKLITGTGSLAARRDMPVGVAGEGGMVQRVLVEPGDWVRAGQTLAVIDRSVQAQEARQLAASIDVARADAALAQQELERAQTLVGRGFISKADLQRKIATRDSANARVRVAEAQLAQSRARIGRLDIRAPGSGLVLERRLEAGQVVSSGSGALFRIADRGEMELVARLPQADLAELRPGTPATVTPVGSAREFAGAVWQVSPVIDPQSRLGSARISIPYAPELRPGGFASVDIRAGSIDAPLLPQSAIQSDQKGNFVYLVDQKGTVVRRDVQVGEVSKTGVAIRQGLNGSERVVLAAGAFLHEGQKVRPQRAAVR